MNSYNIYIDALIVRVRPLPPAMFYEYDDYDVECYLPDDDEHGYYNADMYIESMVKREADFILELRGKYSMSSPQK